MAPNTTITVIMPDEPPQPNSEAAYALLWPGDAASPGGTNENQTFAQALANATEARPIPVAYSLSKNQSPGISTPPLDSFRPLKCAAGLRRSL